MKHENLFKIHIPEPCQAGFNKSLQTTSAFCKACAKQNGFFGKNRLRHAKVFYSKSTENLRAS
jgi:hypothetical protein